MFFILFCNWFYPRTDEIQSDLFLEPKNKNGSVSAKTFLVRLGQKKISAPKQAKIFPTNISCISTIIMLWFVVNEDVNSTRSSKMMWAGAQHGKGEIIVFFTIKKNKCSFLSFNLVFLTVVAGKVFQLAAPRPITSATRCFSPKKDCDFRFWIYFLSK